MAVGGAVLTPAMFEWTHKTFGGNFYLVSISGGTDVCASCKRLFLNRSLVWRNQLILTLCLVVTGSPALPTHAGGEFVIAVACQRET